MQHKMKQAEEDTGASQLHQGMQQLSKRHLAFGLRDRQGDPALGPLGSCPERTVVVCAAAADRRRS